MSQSWIEFANSFGAQITNALWRATWQGCVGVALVWLLCRVWKHMPNGLQCALWLLVCLKVLIALSPATISIPCLPSPTQTPVVQALPGVLVLPPVVDKKPFAPATLPQASASLAPVALTSLVWLVGVTLVASYFIRQFAKSVRSIRKSTPLLDQELIVHAEEMRKAMDLRILPRILVSRDLNHAFTFGTIRPTVLISARVLAECSSDELHMILAHEFAHIRRRDAWLGLIPQVAQAFLWFHPLVWFACREYSLTREAACDEAAINRLGIGFDSYGRLLLRLGIRPSTESLCTPGVSSHFRLLRRRIIMLENSNHLTNRRAKRSVVLVAIAAVLSVAPLSLVQGQSAASGSTKISTTASTPVKVSISPSAKKHPALATQTKSPSRTKQSALRPKTSIRLFALHNADALATAKLLNSVLVLGNANAGKASADRYSNSVIVNAEDTTMAQIADVIRNLDQKRVDKTQERAPSEPQRIAVYQIRYSESDQVRKILDSTFGQALSAVSDKRTNSVIVTATDSKHREVRDLLVMLDKPVEPLKRYLTHIYYLVYVQPSYISKIISDSQKGEDVKFVSVGGKGKDLVVTATAEKQAEISRIITQLDREK